MSRLLEVALLCCGVVTVAHGAVEHSLFLTCVGTGTLGLYVANTWRRP